MKYKARIFNKFEFTHNFLRFLLADRILFKKDNLVLVTGRRGSGKTTLALKIVIGFDKLKEIEEYYNKEANKGKEEIKKYDLSTLKAFELENDMAFTRKKLQDLCRNTRHGFILADEAIVNTARRNAMTKANKILHEVLTINRKNANTVLFCLPSIEDFDISMLQYVTHWIHIHDRGVGAILLPEPRSIFGRKTWDVDRMKKVYEKFKEENPTIVQVPYWLFDNFRGYIRFGALRKDIEEKYLRIAHEEKNKDTEEELKKEEKPRQRLTDEKVKKINEIVEDLLSGKTVDTADYYANCAVLEFNRARLNREVTEILAKKGDGRNALRVIKENKEKDDASYEKRILEKRRVY